MILTKLAAHSESTAYVTIDVALVLSICDLAVEHGCRTFAI